MSWEREKTTLTCAVSTKNKWFPWQSTFLHNACKTPPQTRLLIYEIQQHRSDDPIRLAIRVTYMMAEYEYFKSGEAASGPTNLLTRQCNVIA